MTSAEKQLQLTLRIVGVVFVVGIWPLTVIWPDGFMWEPRQAEYEQMILATLAVLGVFLFLAAREPGRHRLLIWFAVWQSVVHGLVMAVQAIRDPVEQANLIGDVPALLIIAAVMAVMVKRADAASAPAR